METEILKPPSFWVTLFKWPTSFDARECSSEDGKNMSVSEIKDRLNSANADSVLPGKSVGTRFMDNFQRVEKPFFDDFSPRNVTAIVGQSAILHCRVKHLGQRTFLEFLGLAIISIFEAGVPK
ncbi:hypothetical protein RUM44_005868 [Polyplax serrata]|uniref:Uncharacterized protein n=1 Tax=Polyplax serrata TaxID=468196 RepID=A0ABR1AYA3_POLSC